MNNFFSIATVKIAGSISLALALATLTGCSNSNGATSSGAKDPQDLSRLNEGPSPEDLKAMQAAAKGIDAPPAPSSNRPNSERR